MVLVHTHVLIGVLADDPQWADWSIRQLRAQSRVHALAINAVVYAELALTFDRFEALDETVEDLQLQLRHSCASHDALHTLLRDFDEAFCDLHDRPSQGRIKTCLQKQMILLEALGRDMPYVKEYALSSICDEVAH
ncbi:hypothetical protein [Pseudomonas sp. USHLN015]|uniref:hypothetical protein n=1 Tax=Pseudomonas sp. USHLN015 TaxID=3081296 RepID=UPI00301C35BD